MKVLQTLLFLFSAKSFAEKQLKEWSALLYVTILPLLVEAKSSTIFSATSAKLWVN